MPSTSELKTDLLRQIQPLDPQQALLPAPYPDIDATIEQLEPCTPIAAPLEPPQWPALLGSWRLIYASRGTVVTRQLSGTDASGPPPVAIQRVWQTLWSDAASLKTENGADLQLPWLGTLRLQAQGSWKPEDDQSALVTFDRFRFQLTPAGLGWSLPPLTIPLPGFMQRQALWTTSYLDGELRVGRGATGNLFVFQRQ